MVFEERVRVVLGGEKVRIVWRTVKGRMGRVRGGRESEAVSAL